MQDRCLTPIKMDGSNQQTMKELIRLVPNQSRGIEVISLMEVVDRVIIVESLHPQILQTHCGGYDRNIPYLVLTAKINLSTFQRFGEEKGVIEWNSTDKQRKNVKNSFS